MVLGIELIESVNAFLGYAITIVTLMVIYYVGKFFFVEGPTKEEREADLTSRQEAASDWWKGKKKKKEEQDKKENAILIKKKKKDNVSPIKENLRKSIESISEAILNLDNISPKKVRVAMSSFDEEMEKAWKNIRLLRRKLEGSEREQVNSMMDKLEAVRQTLSEQVKQNLPKGIGDRSTWVARIKPFRKSLQAIKGSCGALFKSLEEFHK
jgi:seryl-tRNA synthetase